MEDFPGWTTRFELMWRQEISRHASGRTRVKDFGRPIWGATWVSRSLRPNELDYWRARIDALGYGLGTFQASPKSRCWPQAHPNGTTPVPDNWVLSTGAWRDSGVWLTDVPWSDAGFDGVTVESVGTDNTSMDFAGASGLLLTPGDVFEVDGHMYRVVEPSSNGQNVQFKPYLWPGNVVGEPVVLHRPSVPMTIVPGSVNITSGTNGRGVVSFDSVEAV